MPHDRAALDAAGIHPDDVRDLADLAALPFTTKADLRQSRIGVSVDVEVRHPGGIERSVGKMRRILDERPAR